MNGGFTSFSFDAGAEWSQVGWKMVGGADLGDLYAESGQTFTGLVNGCIEAKFCNKICVGIRIYLKRD